MLFGTDLKFRLAYFFTAFFPAFLLIYFSLVDIHHFLLKETESLPCYLSRNLWHFLMLSVLLSIMLISIYSIRGYINGRRSEENIVKNIVLNFNVSKVTLKNNSQGKVIDIQDGPKINPGFISFVSSTIVPSLVLKFMNGVSALAAIIIIVFFFVLLMLSNDIFPNLILPIFGINLLVTKDNYNIFFFRKDSAAFSGVKRICTLGNTGTMARTFVFFDQEVLNDEIGE
ncbi:hypothetical protein [Streptococcus sp. 5004]|uniref:hypothetical protein n=1 Tax=Streptococcus sp. 5004 TaxID=2582670 RepID=UPI0015637864|nr:hypothetical protein [Streptococcus sp. 5004]